MGYSPDMVQKIKSRLLEHKDLRAGEGEPIAVHAAVTRASSLYENLRNAIDYRDEHLLRKGAIARILRRRLTLHTDIEEISIALLRELVAAGYLPNTSLPESLAKKVAMIIGRYDVLRRCRTASDAHYAWLYGVTVAELDELFDADAERRSLSFFLYERLAESVALSKEEMDPQERHLQIYIACIRAFQKAEDDTLSLTLLRGHFPEWTTPEVWIQAPQEIAYRLVGIESLIRRTLRHHWSVKFLQAVRPYAVALRAIVDVVSKDGGYDLSRLDNPEKCQKEVAVVADAQMSHARSRLRRGVGRAIVYLLLTRIVLGIIRILFGVAFGIPVESIVYGEIDRYSFFINIQKHRNILK